MDGRTVAARGFLPGIAAGGAVTRPPVGANEGGAERRLTGFPVGLPGSIADGTAEGVLNGLVEGLVDRVPKRTYIQ